MVRNPVVRRRDFPLWVTDLKMVPKSLIPTAISNKWAAKKKKLKLPMAEKTKYLENERLRYRCRRVGGGITSDTFSCSSA